MLLVLSFCAMQVISQVVTYDFFAKVQGKETIVPDSVFVENLASGESKMVYKENNAVTITAQLFSTNTDVEQFSEQDFLWLDTQSKVSVSMNRATKLHLMLYNIFGTKISEYASDLSIGLHEFSISAPTGTYVLIANDGTRSASIKIMLSGHGVAQIGKIETTLNSNNVLKSLKDIIKFHNGDEFRFTGYYNRQNDVQTINANVENSSSTITFSFVSVTATVTDITATSAKLSAEIFNENNRNITERGFYIGISETDLIKNGYELLVNSEDFSFEVSLNAKTTYFYSSYVILDDNTIIYDKIQYFTTDETTYVHFIETIDGARIVDGAIQSEFSVSATNKVYFSMGNLQYNATKATHVCADGTTKQGTWRFAEHQYDAIGAGNENIASDYSGWIDLFGWGTSGYNGKEPYMTSTRSSDYGYGTNDIAGTYYDWGAYNPISNGGNVAEMWRTLTRTEWEYILSNRENAELLKGHAIVNGINGFILLPDNWSLPEGITFTYGKDESLTNNYNLAQWCKMAENGAIFLPSTGLRDGAQAEANDVGQENWAGYYISSSANGNKSGGTFFFISNYTNMQHISNYFLLSDGGYRFKGSAVRLVQDVK